MPAANVSSSSAYTARLCRQGLQGSEDYTGANGAGKWAGADANGGIHPCRVDGLSGTSLGTQRVAEVMKQPRSVVTTSSASAREFKKFNV